MATEFNCAKCDGKGIIPKSIWRLDDLGNWVPTGKKATEDCVPCRKTGKVEKDDHFDVDNLEGYVKTKDKAKHY